MGPGATFRDPHGTPPARPKAPYKLAEMRAWYELTTPGGEFNDTLAELDHAADHPRPLDLARTSAALNAWEAAGDVFEADPSLANVAALDASRLALGEAFADDTSDRNDRQTVVDHVQCLAGLDFVREMVASWRPSHYGPVATHSQRDTRRALCGVVYKLGGQNGHAGSSNLDHVTCVQCLEAELARVSIDP